MNFEQRFTQQQKQVQKLAMTQQLQQSIQMLQFNVEELTSFLEQRALENPLIEVSVDRDDTADLDLYRSKPSSISRDDDQENNYMNQVPDNKISLFEYLLEQVHMMRETYLRELMLFLLEYIDKNGYLNITLEEAGAITNATEIQLLDALTLLQQLDPAGVGARDLRECLMLQVERDDLAPNMAYLILEERFEEFAEKKWKKIAKDFDITLSEIQEVWDFVQTLTPAPGAIYEGMPEQYIKPDIVVRVEENKLKVLSAKTGLPVLHFQNDYYQEMQQFKEKDVQKFMKEKFSEYEWLKRSVAQRGETIVKVGTAIVSAQKDFFLKPNHPIKPLTLKEIAEELLIHESTVSRSVNGKYLETSFGIFELKTFFTSALVSSNNESGEDASGADVKRKLTDFVKNEDKAKPLSDQKIVEMLAEEGIEVSRRTIAKYRDALNIPSSTKRKRF
ncbi:RNA polymerase factor sigma-54 [Isobaculum melis]|uniref:RNA polymerase, sigma 54 subunit, RpoN/SigL n=1 Tax=Isobaculum melis TaxID=142588 RepID=A0A1H9QGV8_9LACT|nr:RNA polymerase factor sigma-54 [Isobaculum melis]SER59791.1 RNA polymerase, sigma 54 subunit, RpoN/SigL [Isobaculum melis]